MKFSHLLGYTALAGSMFVAAPVFAQATPNVSNPATATPTEEQTTLPETRSRTVSADGQESESGEVVVTGSRIRRPETDGVLPGVQITAQSIETRGFTNALEALNDIPLVGNGASPLNGNNGGQTASLGAAFVDLLDLGTARTLTLVNSRRFVSGNAASLFVAGNETGSQVDVNVIPATLIQRVDVVTVGGAAAYGADAIAGVVNYILKDDYDGLQLRALTGVSERGDASQYQLSALAGRNFFEGRANLTASFEYNRNDGLQATSRDFRTIRPGTYTNPFNGGVRNTGFTGTAIIDTSATGANNGAFLNAATDGQAATLFTFGLVTQTLSNPGTILSVQNNTFYTPYTPITATVGGQARTSNFITLQNGIASVGFAIPATTPTGGATTITTLANGFFSYGAAQIITGTPGSQVTFNNGTTIGNLSGNGLNGRTTQATNVPFTTFAPTALPANVTTAQVLASYGVTPPAGATAAQQTAIAVNLLQANRFTSREFLAANPNTNLNYFIGTFDPAVPRIANTDTSLVSVRVNGANVQVPVNQVLPYVAVPLQFNDDGSIRQYTFSGPVSGNDPITVNSARGGNGGFRRSLENTVLRTQQDRYIANLLGKFDLNDQITLFTENVYSRVLNRSLGNIAGAQNFITNSSENAALQLNFNNPYLDAADRATLTSVGIAPGQANQGNFLLTRQNQDIFGANPYTNKQETYRFVVGARSDFEFLGKNWNAEISGTYGRSEQKTRSAGIRDIEYQLALDAVDQGIATTGVANGNIVCRAQVFPGQYLGRTPIGTSANITRLPGADGLPTEQIVTPTITQDMISACRPLNPFGYDQMSAESKAYVVAPTLFRNISQQKFVQAIVGGGLFDLPAGTVQVNANGEYRRDEADFSSDLLNIQGRSRSAPSANTSAFIETYEIGGEIGIPLTGPNFLSFLGRSEFRPAIRVSQQSGRAATFRNLQGVVSTPRSNGDPATIYSLAGTWAPIQDISFRGNITRSIRQPSIVELFLGGQPTFQAVTDLCSVANIDAGVVPATRRANCVAAVIANGNAGDAAAATAFLRDTFVPQGGSLQGTFSGSPDLAPERGRSWTAGAALTPRFIPGLTLQADYISVDVRDTITVAGIGTFLQACFDSPTFPDSSPQTGVNGCSRFSRGPDFQIQNGVQAGFLNLGATEVRAINMTGNYAFDVGPGRVLLRANAYHLIRYDFSSSGTFVGDRVKTAGTFDRPSWKTQLSGRYEQGGVYGQLTWNMRSSTRLFVSGIPATIENFPFSRYPDLHNVDFALGADVTDKFRIQFNVANLLDETTAGNLGTQAGTFFDDIGRRFQVAVTARF